VSFNLSLLLPHCALVIHCSYTKKIVENPGTLNLKFLGMESTENYPEFYSSTENSPAVKSMTTGMLYVNWL